MKKIIALLLLTTLFSSNVFATAKEAYEIFKKDHSKLRYRRVAHELIDGKFYFSSIPYINKYLDETNEIDEQLEQDIETLVVKTGTMAVLNLEEKKLEKFNIPSVSLIHGTRLFNREQYDKSYEILSRIPDTHPFSLEAALIKGTIKSLQKKNIEAINHYNACISKAQKAESGISDEKMKRYYTYMKETCVIRTARLKIEDKRYEEALEIYQTIDKRSYRWPYILMDMAWANYYLKDYNRTLGLTVTYKSPLLESYFFPEAEVLTSLAYYNLCQWDDALKVVEHFYEDYQPKALALKKILGENKESDTYFLDLYYADSSARDALNPFIRNMITQTRKQIKFNLDLASLMAAKEEAQLVKKLKNKNELTAEMEENIDNTISFISKKINTYIKREIFNFINEIHKHSYSMFNLQLELLSKKREEIYTANEAVETRDRGSEKNIKRKMDQYFFDFNGSFWADELGDYSFGLENRCKDQKVEIKTEVKPELK
jgi:tetratricopeptide (TPR) repeat protein